MNGPRDPDFTQRLSALFRERQALDELSVSRALKAQRDSGERFDLVVVRLGLVSETTVAQLLAEYCSLPFAPSASLTAAKAFDAGLNSRFLRSARVVPISDSGDRVIMAAADPFNQEAVQAVGYQLGRAVELHVATASDIDAAIERLYGDGKSAADAGASMGTESEAADDDIQRLKDMASEAPIIRLLQDLIVRAVNQLASDIHVEPAEDCVRVRYRIDGLLHTVETLPLDVRAALSSRVKILARLNIAERRLPQDGRAKVSVRGREIDLRVSTMPTLWGESLVLRILDKTSVELDFAKLGFASRDVGALAQLLAQPNGIILVTGPTGSGKTTTLYTALSTLNSNERKIFTVEDPIEYQLPGINQIQVKPRIGLTFATALRSILRQDPDIIMVGEIRDLETAQVAIQASLTGHLVLSTVHTNSAAATVTRLIDMGIEKYLLASCLKGVLAQRLVRKLCSECAVPANDLGSRLAAFPDSVKARIAANRVKPMLKQMAGCQACRRSGFSGRTTIYELLTTSPALRQAILADQSEAALENIAIAEGLVPMLENGLSKVCGGETTPDEIYRATQFERCQILPIEPMTSAES